MTVSEENNKRIIDLVYLWCDGNDPVWCEKKEKTLLALNIKVEKGAANECRFVQSDELMYSLRSVEKFAPWINNIFIVTDNQVPKWLNLNNSKIHIVDHKDIMPAKALPTFNSMAIECCLPYIEELSEYFLFANDDTMLWNKVEKDLFYTNSGKPICRMRQKIHKKPYKHLYGYTIAKAYKMVKSKYKLNAPYFPHHNIDAYRKSYFLDCINEYREEFNKTVCQQFREFESVQRSIVSYYMLAKDSAVLKCIEKPWYNPFFSEESVYAKCLISKLKNLDKKDCKFICVNDSERSTNSDREYMQKILEAKFPEKSSFEI